MKQTKSFRLLWLGQAIANLGDSFYILAVVTLIYQLTESVTLSALPPVVRLMSQLLSGLIAPLLLERFPLRSLLALSQLGQTLLLSGLTIYTMVASLTSSYGWIWLFIAFIAFFDGWSTPARNALVPRLVDQQELVKANSILSTTDQTVMMLGWTLGGVLVAQFGSGPILWLTVFCFALSAVAMFLIHDPYQLQRKGESKPSQSNWETMKEGWVILFSHPTLKRLTWMDVLEYTAGTVWSGAIMLAFVEHALHQDESWWGFLNGSYFAGAILGGLLIMRYTSWIERHLFTALLIGSLGMAILTFLFATTSTPLIALILCLVMGPPYQAREIAQRTLLQTQMSIESLPKVYAAHGTISFATFGFAVLGMGLLTDYVDVKTVYILSALLSACSSIIAFTLKRKKRSLAQQV